MLDHLVCIMDGNRRWAQQNTLAALSGYTRSLAAIKTTVQFCLDQKINYLSLYTFSVENLKRSEQEKYQLFNYLVTHADQLIDYFIEYNARVQFVGDRDLFPALVKDTCAKIEQQTQHCTGLFVQLLFCYGGQQEIVCGVKRVVKEVQEGLLALDDLDEQAFAQQLWMTGIPTPDLIIRTGGHKRLSNCLLFQAAYSELCFLDCLWPDLTVDHLRQAVHAFRKSTRKFGM